MSLGSKSHFYSIKTNNPEYEGIYWNSSYYRDRSRITHPSIYFNGELLTIAVL